MNVSMFPEWESRGFGVPSSHLLVGKSCAGKTHLLQSLLSPLVFQDRFGLRLEDCSKILLVFKSWQTVYSQILANFTCPSVLSPSLKREYSEGEFWAGGRGGNWALAIVDDQLSELGSGSRKNESLETLETLLTVSAHHSSLVIFLLLQDCGSGSSPKLRSLLRQFSHYFVFAGTDAITLRYLASFLLPYQTKTFSSIVQSFAHTQGRYLLAQQSFASPVHRLLSLDTNSPPSRSIDTLYMPIEL